MTDSTPTAENRIDRDDVPKRTRRALEQYLTVTPDIGRARGADDLVLVSSESGSEYLVDLRAGRCTCEDYQYREADCKHRKRSRWATGREPIPADAAAACDVDATLGDHTDATLAFAAADGGIIDADADAEILDEDSTDAETDAADERPDDCSCLPSFAPDAPPCFACWLAEFDVPNPDPDTAGDDQDSADRDEPTRSEPADFGGGESTGVQDL